MTLCEECNKDYEDIIQHYSDEHNQWPILVANKRVRIDEDGVWII